MMQSWRWKAKRPAAGRRSLAAQFGARRSARGSTLTEFAFILPVLLMGVFGVIDFGRALYTYHFVSDAAREASRWASVRGNRCITIPNCGAGESDIQHYVASIVPPGIDSTSPALSVTAAWMAPLANPASCVGPINNPGCAVKVHVTYNFKFILPFLPKATYAMDSTSEMIISQ
jgi:hypothetical protein